MTTSFMPVSFNYNKIAHITQFMCMPGASKAALNFKWTRTKIFEQFSSLVQSQSPDTSAIARF